MNRAIERLAHAIDEDWGQSGRTAGALPEIAASHLSGQLEFSVEELIDDLSEARALPPQRLLDQTFGQPQVTLYSGEAFEIEALFWHTGTPAIHQHAFAGAFRLLAGRSAHCRYRFEPRGQIDRVTVGRLEVDHFEILQAGRTAPIPYGASLIHSAFHIDSPSVTLVVRTEQDKIPELTYLPPGVAYDSADRGAALHKKLQLLDTLATTHHPKYGAAVDAAIMAGDAYDGLAVLIRAGGHAIDDVAFRGFADRLRTRHRNRHGIETIVRAGFAERRRIRLVQSRHAMTDPDSRVFLAALLSFSDRDALFAGLADYAGSAGAVHDMIASGVARLFGGDAERELLARTAVSTKLAGGPENAFVEAVSTMRDTGVSEKETEGLVRFYRQLTEHWLLTPLFDQTADAVRAAS